MGANAALAPPEPAILGMLSTHSFVTEAFAMVTWDFSEVNSNI
jgi:hypothetical protein